ncbi:serine/threonine-protein kinase [Mycobacterium sp. 050128]|uniref:serine/threonine-protein kinase n=1 Tax=Mycobacterium sp. 050128 TaxID=3096112 RepID=UPI002ED9FBD2
MPQSDGLPEGALFAGFRIVRRLGAGGMGEVYLAQHPRLPRRDALKILPGELTDNLEFRQRFNREADLAASLYNEHIVGIHDRGEYEGQLWISMDYVEGTDAAQLLRQYPSGLPKADVIEIIAAMADALDYAHSRGLLHRDVKPANILISDAAPRRRILLADFGIARELGEISGLTATNMMMGTTAYCAPEQLQGLDIDGRADQYALGCTAFNLLTGTAPFQNSNPAVVITQHLSAPPPPVSERRPDLADLDGALAKALAKNPADRFATCTDFAAALGSQLGTAADTVGPTQAAPIADTEAIASPQTTSAATAPARSTRRTAVAVAVIVGLALVGLGLLVGVRVFGGSHQSGNGGAHSVAPSSGHAPASAKPGIKLTRQITDQAGALGPIEYDTVNRALTTLYNTRGTRLWVVYVKTFDGQKPFKWAEDAMRANNFTDNDAILAVATEEPAYSFRVPNAVTAGKAIDLEVIRRDRISPAVFRHEWTRAAIEAANSLDVAPR